MGKEDKPIQMRLPPRFNATSAILDANVVRGASDRIALYYQDEKITYRDIQKMVNRVGNSLKDLGIELENRIAILLSDCPQWAASFYGAAKIGAVPVPLNAMFKPSDFQYFLNDTRAKAIIVGDDLLPHIESIRHNLKYLKHVIVVGQAKKGQLAFDKLVDAASPELEAADTCEDDALYWLYTSGSTGPPKGTIHLHHDLLQAPEFAYKGVFGITKDDIIFGVPRLFFHYGVVNLAGTLYNGAAQVLDREKPTPERVFEVVKRYRPSILCGVPTFFANMLAAKNTERHALSSVRLAISAGEALPAGVFRSFKDRFGVEIVEGIGCTEACCWYIANRPGNVKPGSTGQVVPGCEVKIVDEQLREVPRGETGELMVKTESMASSYWNKHQRSKEAFLGEWLRTGDRFYQDEEGYFWFRGRVDDIIEAGGIKVVPTEVEATLIEHPAVVESAVVGAADEYGLSKPKAFVVLSKGYEPSPELVKELQQFVKARIAPYNYPRWIEFVEELPKTATGKIQRFKLR